MKDNQTTEINLTEEELCEIVRKHFAETLLACHNKRGGFRSSLYYNEQNDVYKFEFSTTEGDIE